MYCVKNYFDYILSTSFEPKPSILKSLFVRKKEIKREIWKERATRRSIKKVVEDDIKKLVLVCCSAGCTGVGRPSDRTRAAMRTAD